MFNRVFSKLSRSIRNFKRELNLSNNELRELPVDIDKLVQLEVLNLSTNRLRLLPSQIGCLRNLRELVCLVLFNIQSFTLKNFYFLQDLEENELDCVPSDIGFLTSLTKVRSIFITYFSISIHENNKTFLNFFRK